MELLFPVTSRASGSLPTCDSRGCDLSLPPLASSRRSPGTAFCVQGGNCTEIRFVSWGTCVAQDAPVEWASVRSFCHRQPMPRGSCLCAKCQACCGATADITTIIANSSEHCQFLRIRSGPTPDPRYNCISIAMYIIKSHRKGMQTAMLSVMKM